MQADKINSKTRTKRRSQVYVTCFFVFIAAFSYFLTRTMAPKLDALKAQTVNRPVFYSCIEVLSGDSMIVKTQYGTQKIKINGISAPQPGTPSAWWNKEYALPVEQYKKAGFVSKNSLSAWITKLPLLIEWPDGLVPQEEREAIAVSASVSGVDIGYQQIREGQAVITPASHKRVSLYTDAQRVAQSKRKGFWRFAAL